MLAVIASVLSLVAKALGLGLLLLLVLGLDIPKRWKLRHIPGPPALPYVGHLPQLIKLGSPTFFRQCRAKYGPLFKISFGRSWPVVVADPELARQVGAKLLNHSAGRSLMRGEYDKLDGWGLVAARDDYWRTVRAAWQPAFSSASLAGYLPRMVECAGLLAGRLEGLAAEQVDEGSGDQAAPRVDMWRELGSMTLQVVGSTAYGVDFQAIEGSERSQGDEAQRGPHQGEQGDGVAAPKIGAGTTAATPLAATAAAATAGGRHYGRVLVGACRDFFRYSSLLYGSKYNRVAMLLPELRPLVSLLAHTLPDLPFQKLLQARAAVRDAGMSLINGWKAGKSATETVATTNGTPAANGVSQNGSLKGKEAAAAADVPASMRAVVTAEAAAAPAVEAGSFLGLMLSARDRATGEGLNDLQIAAQVQTFILAGYETTANALAFAVYCLATNPEVEARLLAEIDSVLGPDRPPTESDLSLLPYTEAVFNEAMRLYPPAHVTTRSSDKAPIQVGGYTIPAGTALFLSIYSAHNDPDVWPRADEFIPERFMPSSPLHPAVCARVPHAHAPFGYGSRMCVGWKFAVQEAKVALARLYQRLRFELEPGQVPLRTSVGITMAPKNGVWVRPVRRVMTPSGGA